MYGHWFDGDGMISKVREEGAFEGPEKALCVGKLVCLGRNGKHVDMVLATAIECYSYRFASTNLVPLS